ncbi:MAG: hypothetical protein VKK04_12125 [Synechococcales bacterium]|nr:hypothetical protein [Synechococcales bacterium]
MIRHLHTFLTAPSLRLSSPRTLFWFFLSLSMVLIYSLMALPEAFSTAYVIQDDARQHVFWMQRFVDPALFPDDWIADYFQSVAPAGYQLLYRMAAAVGLSPILFHKLLPVALNLVMAGYAFATCLCLLPVPAAAFSATLFLGQGLGITDAIVSGTPKAFIYPLLLAFLYYLLRGRLVPILVTIALEGLFYPQLVFLSAGVLALRLGRWQGGRLRLTPVKRDRLLSLAGLAVAFFVLLPYAFQSSEFGPTLTLAEARDLPELALPGSRSRFFYDDDPAAYWLEGRSGLRLATALTPVTNALGLLLPFLGLFPKRFPLVREVRPTVAILPQLLIASLTMFVAAHLLLFRLHLPSRYTQHSFRIILSLAAGMALVVLVDALLRWAGKAAGGKRTAGAGRSPGRGLVGAAITGLLGALVLGYPALVSGFPITAYQVGQYPELYEFLRSQPTDSLIASLSNEVNNLPSFARRSILTGSEYAIPYHTGYYTEIRQRTLDLIRAQYSADPTVVQNFVDRYGVTHWLLDRNAFQPAYLSNQPWIQQYPAAAQAAREALLRETPALSRLNDCVMFADRGLSLLDARCITDSLAR